MTRINRIALAATVLSAVALWVPAPSVAAPADGTIVVAQQPDPNAPKDPRHQQQRQNQQTPPPKPAVQPPHPAVQQQVTPPAKPTVQQPTAPQRPVVQQPPVQQPPPAAHLPPSPPPGPAARQPPVNQPAAQQPATSPPAAVHRPEQMQRPVGQQPVPQQVPTVQQPVTPPPPPAALHRPDQMQRPVGQQPVPQPVPTVQQPVTPPPPPAALHRPDQMQRPVGQQPVVPQQVPTAQRPVQAPQLEVAKDHQQILEHQQRAEEWRSRRVQDLREQRHEEVENGRTVIREPDRTIIVENGRPIIRHNEVDRFGFGARDVQVQQRGGETFTIVERPGGVRIVTVVDADGRFLRRLRRGPDGRDVVIIDNGGVYGDRDRDAFFLDLAPPVVRIPRERYIVEAEVADAGMIFEALTAPPIERIERRYSLDEVRFNEPLLERMPRVDIDTITFETGSWTVTPDQVGRLSVIAEAINRAVSRSPQEVFLIEGHTDAVGSDVDNLSLSDRRAETVASVLTEQFQVPPENMTTQGYGKQYLKIPTDGPERRNRRVTVRRITPLLTGQNGPPAN
jgi:outer membrane protein OmpA-like peptidoglycan-associated protein